MALNKQSIAMNFSQGLETKVDPYQVAFGKFLSLNNSVFLKGGLLSKRNGYGALSPLPDTSSTFLTTFDNALTAIGTSLEAYSGGYGNWVNQGSLIPASLSTLSLVKNATNQSQVDSVVSTNGLVCTVYTDLNPDSAHPSFYYIIADSVTGQVITGPTSFSADVTYGTPRVFFNGNYFLIAYTDKPSSLYRLVVLPVSIVNPTVSLTLIVAATTYTPASTVAWDGVCASGSLYLAYNGASSSGVKVLFIDASLTASSTVIADGSHAATMFSVTFDSMNSRIWVSYYNLSGTTIYTLVRDLSLNSVLAGTAVVNLSGVLNITSTAYSGTANVLYEVSANYGYDSTVPSHYVAYKTVTQSGTVGTQAIIQRGVGLSTKAFLISSTTYFGSAYQSSYQSTFFIENLSGQVIAKIAYGNAYGYLTTGLPSVSVTGRVARWPYLYRDVITAVNKNTAVASSNQIVGIFSQFGVNQASLNFIAPSIISAEIGSNLNLTGGIVWAYDGYKATEQSFHVWPDSVLASDNGAIATTGDTHLGTKVIDNIASLTGVLVGMGVTGTGIPTSTVVASIDSATQITVSKNSTGNNTATALSFKGAIVDATYYYIALYEFTDNQGNLFRSAPSIPAKIATSSGGKFVTVNVPTLRLTYKAATSVKIEIYRWVVSQPIYYQVTSVSAPTLNSTSVDSITFVDILDDASILGNSILYTTGGVIENIGPPAFDSTFIFDDRLWGIDSEDKNLLWYSKQIIEATPVEFSDLFTLYVAPNVGAQGPTGVLKCGSSLDDKLILFKESAINYIAGSGPDNTGSNNQYTQPIFITSTVGCSNQKSIVFIPNGLMFEFASPSGNQIWLLGRNLSTEYIGASVEGYTQNATVLSSVNIPGTNQVRFTLSSGITLMYDYYYGHWGTFTNVPALSSCLYQGLHTYLDVYGRVFQETPGKYLDGDLPVLMSFQTGWAALAGLQGYQRAYYMTLLGTYYSPHMLNLDIAYDYDSSSSSHAVISPQNYSPAYGGDLTYGSGSPYGGPKALESWRIYFNQQRCQSIQLSLNEVYDPSFGVASAAGFTLSGIQLVIGAKSQSAPYRADVTVGAS